MLGVLFALTACLGWGSSSIFSRVSLQHLRPTTGALLSLIAGTTLVLSLALVFNGTAILSVPLGMLGWIVLAGTLQFPLGRLLNFTGVQLVGVSRAATLFGISPLVATILAIVFGGESITVPLLIGTLSVTTGIALIVSSR